MILNEDNFTFYESPKIGDKVFRMMGTFVMTPYVVSDVKQDKEHSILLFLGEYQLTQRGLDRKHVLGLSIPPRPTKDAFLRKLHEEGDLEKVWVPGGEVYKNPHAIRPMVTPMTREELITYAKMVQFKTGNTVRYEEFISFHKAVL